MRVKRGECNDYTVLCCITTFQSTTESIYHSDKCVIAYPIAVCVNTLYGACTTTKLTQTHFSEHVPVKRCVTVCWIINTEAFFQGGLWREQVQNQFNSFQWSSCWWEHWRTILSLLCILWDEASARHERKQAAFSELLFLGVELTDSPSSFLWMPHCVCTETTPPGLLPANEWAWWGYISAGLFLLVAVLRQVAILARGLPIHLAKTLTTGQQSGAPSYLFSSFRHPFHKY